MKKKEKVEHDQKLIKVINQDQSKTKREDIVNEIKEEVISKKKKICGLIYRLLQSVCIDNIVNKQKTANYLPLFAMHSKYIP